MLSEKKTQRITQSTNRLELSLISYEDEKSDQMDQAGPVRERDPIIRESGDNRCPYCSIRAGVVSYFRERPVTRFIRAHTVYHGGSWHSVRNDKGIKRLREDEPTQG